MTSPLIDCHVHVRDAAAAALAAAAGVVALRDAGTKDGAGLRVAAAGRGGATVVSAGWALSKRGGYGARFGVGVAGGADLSAEIARLAQAGAAIIKIMASGMVSLRAPGTITAGGFSPDEIRLIVEDARRWGLGVMAHANGEAAIIACAEAGVRSVEHGFFMTDRALDALGRSGVFWVPTGSALERAAAAGESSGGKIEELIAGHLAMISKAHAHGVKLALGTDAVLPDARYRELYAAEAEFFRRAGLSRSAVERIAGEAGKELLGI